MKRLLLIVLILSIPVMATGQAKVRGGYLFSSAIEGATATTNLALLDADSVGIEILLLQAAPKTGPSGGWFVYSDSLYPEGIIAFNCPTKEKQWVRKEFADEKLLNARWYGAVGDSTTDDGDAIRAIFANAISIARYTNVPQVKVFIPPGKYRIGDFASGYGRANTTGLRLFPPLGYSQTAFSINVSGYGATIISDLGAAHSDTSIIWLWLAGNMDDLVIEGITFQNIADQDTCIRIALTIANDYAEQTERAVIRDCIFIDFNRAISLAYNVPGLVIDRCRFLWSDGRDSGILSNTPCVGIWANTAFTHEGTITVQNCYMDGCISNDVTGNANPRGADGLVYGASRRWQIIGNTIEDYGYEAIYINANQTDSTRWNYGSEIIGNKIFNRHLTGGADQFSDWGIRVDTDNVTITGNTITGCYEGINCTGTTAANAYGDSGISNIIISDNIITMADSSVGAHAGINFEWVRDSKISDNIIAFDNYQNKGSADVDSFVVGIRSTGTTTNNFNLNITGNIIYSRNQTSTPDKLRGMWIQWSDSVFIANNTFRNCDTGIYLYNNQFATITEGTNLFINCVADRFATPGALEDITQGTALEIGAGTRMELLGFGSDAFTTTAAADTVLISGALATDKYWITAYGSAAVDQQDVLQAEAKADTLIVKRLANGASGLTYSYLRLK